MPSVALNDIDHMRESVFFDQMVTPAPTAKKRAVNRRNAILVIVAFFALILIPLVTSARAGRQRRGSCPRLIQTVTGCRRR